MGTMLCPHCQAVIDDKWGHTDFGNDSVGHFVLRKKVCVACERLILGLEIYWMIIPEGPHSKQQEYFDSLAEHHLIYPKTSSRPPAPPEVPPEFAKDFDEACLVLEDSPNASAALSRRCLQNIIRHHVGIKKDNLYGEIEELLKKADLPSHIAEDLHTIRDAGNIAAHPWKDPNTGLILDVDPEEAELTLNVLESMFDLYFVGPSKAAKRRTRLQRKAKDADK